MIKRLRLKFILLSMLSLLALLAVIIVGMNLMNYISFVNETDELLELLSRNKGMFPEFDQNRGDRFPLPEHISPETPYESRYFTVLIDKDENIVQIDLSKTATVSERDAVSFAEEALVQGNEVGFVGEFRYMTVSDEFGSRLTFLDCGRKLDALYSFALSSVSMALIGYLLIFVVVFFLSGRIIRPVAESYEKQKRFITDAGHEIKTPLTIINANADLAEMEQGENEYLSEIKQQTKRLSELTGNLVYLAKMEESGEAMTMIDIPLSDVINEALSPFNALAVMQNKELLQDVEPMISAKGNAAAQRQLVSILMDNALKYSPERTAIKVSLKKQGKTACLTVSNLTSFEISKEDLPKLFDRFYRPDASRNSRTGGNGIGLSIAKAIVDAHGGRIQAKGEQRSLAITVTLPIQ